MKAETTVFYFGHSVVVRIPAGMARYFDLKDIKSTKKCTIEDTGKKSAVVLFE